MSGQLGNRQSHVGEQIGLLGNTLNALEDAVTVLSEMTERVRYPKPNVPDPTGTVAPVQQIAPLADEIRNLVAAFTRQITRIRDITDEIEL